MHGRDDATRRFDRLTHKTLSLNLATSLILPVGYRAMWIGLIDSKPSMHGLDVELVGDSPVFFFHFKTSQRVLAEGRAFTLGADHLQRLRRAAGGIRGKAFYVLPSVGTQRELAQQGAARSLWFVDVCDLSATSLDSYEHVRIILRPPFVKTPDDLIEASVLADTHLETVRTRGVSFALPEDELEQSGMGFFAYTGHWVALVLLPDDR